MRKRTGTAAANFVRAVSRPLAGAAYRAMALALMLALPTGCTLSPLARHSVAFSAATAIVIDSSEDAYRTANTLHRSVLVYAAVTDYDKNPAWNPYTDPKPFLTPAELAARIKVLDGLKAYAATLVTLTSAKTPADLATSSAAIGSNLRTLSTTAATDLATAIPGIPAMTAPVAAGIGTALDGLGQFLIERKAKAAMKSVTAEINSYVKTLCELLDSDIVILRRQADVDYQTVLTSQDQLIRHSTVDPFVHRAQIGQLIDLAAQQKANDELLAKLQKALHTLDLTHQALAAAAQGNDPVTIKQRIVDLAAAGQDLATFYKSMPTT